jgi:hypothetical protein
MRKRPLIRRDISGSFSVFRHVMNPSDPTDPSDPKVAKSFREAGEEKSLSLGQEIVLMLKQNKKYWMIPLLIVLLIFGVLLILGATSAAPFIYTLF